MMEQRWRDYINSGRDVEKLDLSFMRAGRYSANCSVMGFLSGHFTQLRDLCMMGCGLDDINGFPKLLQLKKLDLSENKISGGFGILKKSKKLYHLALVDNSIQNLSPLQDLKKIKNLRVLDLTDNEVTKIKGYRRKVFQMLPQLIYLDGVDRSGNHYGDRDTEDEDDSDEDDEEDDDDDDDDSESEEEEEEEEEEHGSDKADGEDNRVGLAAEGEAEAESGKETRRAIKRKLTEEKVG